MYLKQSLDNGYIIKVCGKNGEGIPNVVIDLSLKHKLISPLIANSKLKTNQEGEVVLGKLVDFSYI